MKPEDWTTTFTTHSREEAIRVSAFMARAFEPRFFHDPDNIPVVAVTGGFNNGKSMICEAMSRALLDQEGVEGMIDEGQRFHHYMETAPSSALSNYCAHRGTIAGAPAVVSFDRLATMDGDPTLSLDDKFQENFKYYAPVLPYRLSPGFNLSAKGRIKGPDGRFARLGTATSSGL